MITEDQKKKYEEAAFQYRLSKLGELHEATPAYISRLAFEAGAEHAHPIAHSEGKKEGWNEALEAVRKAIWPNQDDESKYKCILPELLQKLRK